jgi:uncharacterized protein
MNITFEIIILVSLVAFFAGFIDAIVGGGGLVQVPVLFIIFPNWAISQVIGTNRFASFMGTSIAAYQYTRQVRISWKLIGIMGIATGVFSYLGATISSQLKAEFLKPIMFILMLFIGLYTYLKKDLGQNSKVFSENNLLIKGILMGMLLGFYNGFFGPGTGSLLVFGFVSFLGFEFLKASASSKIINVVADVSSLIFFVWNGKIVYLLAIPMAVCNILGSYVGSKMAIRRGSKFIRIIFLVVVFGLILRFGWDIISQNP